MSAIQGLDPGTRRSPVIWIEILIGTNARDCVSEGREIRVRVASCLRSVDDG